MFIIYLHSWTFFHTWRCDPSSWEQRAPTPESGFSPPLHTYTNPDLQCTKTRTVTRTKAVMPLSSILPNNQHFIFPQGAEYSSAGAERAGTNSAPTCLPLIPAALLSSLHFALSAAPLWKSSLIRWHRRERFRKCQGSLFQAIPEWFSHRHARVKVMREDGYLWVRIGGVE